MEVKEKIFAILIFVAAVILATFLVSLFSKKPKEIDYKALIEAKDQVIQSVIRERDTYRQWKEDINKKLEEKDSLLQIKEKTVITRYEKIPVIVSNYSDAELRSAVESFR